MMPSTLITYGSILNRIGTINAPISQPTHHAATHHLKSTLSPGVMPETTLQEHRRFVGRKVTMDDVINNGGRESLVNMSRRDRLPVVGAVNLTRFMTNPL